MLQAIGDRLAKNVRRSFQYRDFRLLWFGAFFSFMGGWIQTTAQGWLVYEMTGDRSKLAWVTFCAMIPMAILGPFGGALVDSLNRRRLLITCQAVYGTNALILALGVTMGWVRYEHILAVALINGVMNTVETPARQSLVSSIIPPEDIPAAVPVNAMTFNLSRILGPAVAGILLTLVGPQICYLANGFSYLALIFALLAIRTDISTRAAERAPILDLVSEGMRYAWRDRRLRMLLLMEITVSMFAMFYLPMMPAIAKDMLGLGEAGLGFAMTAVGVGTKTALITLMALADRPFKGFLSRLAMVSIGMALLLLSFVREPWLAYPLLAIAGASGVMLFNTTNTLFQLLSPDHLRGRVLALHIWAISGFGPLSMPFLGALAQAKGMPVALQVGAGLVLGGAFLAWKNRAQLAGV